MLYIRGHKIIKGYVGNTPISHVGFGKSGLIKIKSENGGSDYPNNLIAKYTANTSGVLPTFNSGYQYTVNETELNGIYTVELSSDTDFSHCSFYNKSELLTLEYLKVTSNVTGMDYMFRNCSKLTQLDVSNWDTSKVTTMMSMFRECTKLTQLDVSNWDISKDTTMDCMFYECYALKEIKGLNNWDISSVEYSLYSMFYYAKSLEGLDLSSWDVSNITDMRWLFSDCSALKTLNISNWSFNNEVITTEMLLPYSESEMTINKIIMNDSDYNSVNKIISELPTRASDSMGTLNINGVDDISLVDESALNSKNWALSKVGH